MPHKSKIIAFLMAASFMASINNTVFSAEPTKEISAKKNEQDITLWSKGGQKLTLWADVRFRYEIQDNFNAKAYGDQPVAGEADDKFMLGRFRLGVMYEPNKHISLSLGGQHCAVWDMVFGPDDFYKDKFRRENNPYEEDVELFDTYLMIKDLFNNSLSMKFGRQRFSYGDKRIFGPGLWGNTVRWIWDAAKVSYKPSFGFVDVYYGRTMLHDSDEFSLDHPHGFESMGIYSRFELPKRFPEIGIEPFVITKNNKRSTYKGEDGRYGELESYYVGARINGKNIVGFDFDCTYIMQDGDWGSDEIDAFGYHALLAYNFNEVPFKPYPSIEYSYASGDSDPNDGKHETFDGAFGARAMKYGRMNMFHWMNLKDTQVNMVFEPAKKIKFTAGLHQFWLAEEKDAWYLNPKNYRDKTSGSGDKIGKEFDLVGVIDLPRKNQVQFGYGHFWPDEFAENITGSNKKANWAFVQWMLSL